MKWKHDKIHIVLQFPYAYVDPKGTLPCVGKVGKRPLDDKIHGPPLHMKVWANFPWETKVNSKHDSSG